MLGQIDSQNFTSGQDIPIVIQRDDEEMFGRLQQKDKRHLLTFLRRSGGARSDQRCRRKTSSSHLQIAEGTQCIEHPDTRM